MSTQVTLTLPDDDAFSTEDDAAFLTRTIRTRRASYPSSAPAMLTTTDRGQVFENALRGLKSSTTQHVAMCIRTVRSMLEGRVNTAVNAGAVRALVSALSVHLACTAIVENACRLLACLALESDVARRQIADERGVQRLCTVIEKYFGYYAAVTEAAVCALGASCEAQFKRNQQCLENVRGIEWILTSMRRWHDMRSFQNAALLCIARVASEHERNQKLFASFGTLHEVVSVMTYYSEDAAVQLNAIQCIISLATDNTENQTALGSEGAISVIVIATRNYAFNADIIAAGGRAIRTLCMVPENRERLAAASGVDSFVEALIQNAHRKGDVNKDCHKCSICDVLLGLGNAVLGNATNRAAVCRIESLQAVIVVLQTYKGDEEVTEYAMRLLRNVTYKNFDDFGRRNKSVQAKSEKSRMFGRKKRPKIVLLERIVIAASAALCAHLGHPAIVEDACAVLYNVCALGRERLIRRLCSDVHVVLQKAVETHSTNDTLVKHAVALAQYVK